ncbi:tetratricopeptide repeat protein [Streptomyces longisporus]|uniref:Tetratricopeptide repeat protein n=1 Tax=Streptomyces longisporus TaxID=1948 RepID=A0ABN3NK38_STRLO
MGGSEDAFFVDLRRLGQIHGRHLAQRVSLRALSRGAGGPVATTIGAWLDGSRFPQQVDALVSVVEQLRTAAAAEGFEPVPSEARLLDPLWWRDQHAAVGRERAESVRVGVRRAQAQAIRQEQQAAAFVGRPISQLNPFDLEVHHGVEVSAWSVDTILDSPYAAWLSTGWTSGDGLPELTPYILRSHDEELSALVSRGEAGHSAMAMLVGGSSCGKTRACWEAVQTLGEGWRLWHPFDPTRPEAALADLQNVGPRTVVWLNEAQHYLLPSTSSLGERVAAGIRALLRDQARRPVLVLGTMWPEYWDTLTALPAPHAPDVHEQTRKLLAGTNISVPSAFSSTDLRALLRDGLGDPRLLYAVQRARGGQITQYLAGAPSLLERYRNAPVVARAVLQAAMDARRLGHGLALPHPLLAAAAPGYLTDEEWDQTSDDWLEEALAYTAKPCHGARGALTRIKPRPGQAGLATPHYRLADYLEEHGRNTRYSRPVPDTLWEAAFQHAHVEDLFAFARSAASQRGPEEHLRFAVKAAANGDHAAAWQAAETLSRSGRLVEALAMYQRAADGGAFVTARRKAAALLHQLGRLDEALQEYQAAAGQGHLPSVHRAITLMHDRGDRTAAATWCQRLAEQTDLDILDTAITLLQQTGHDSALTQWLCDLAERGRPGALARAADLLQHTGRADEAVAWLVPLAQAGYLGAELLVAEILEESGHLDEAITWYRRATESGYPSARSALTRLSATSVPSAP